MPKLPCEGEFLLFICRCCYTSLTTHAQDLISLRSAECISVTPGSAPLLYGTMKRQMHKEIFHPYMWPWMGWFNEVKNLGISTGLNLSLIFLALMLLSLSNYSTSFLILFSPRLNGAQREEAQEANAALEVNYISFILFCYVQFDLSYQWYILRDLQYCVPQLPKGEVAGFRSHGL